MANGPGSTRQNNGPFTVGGFYNFAPFTLVDGQACALQFDINGNLKVTSTGGGGGGSNPAAGPTGAPVPADADYLGINIGGTLFGVTGFNLPDSIPIAVAIVNANGDQITSFGGGVQYADDAASGAAPTGTLSMGWDSANSVVRALKVDSSQNLLVNVANTSLSVTQGTSPWVISGSISFTAPQHVIVDSGTLSVTQGTSPWVTQDLADGSVTGGMAGTFSQLAGGIFNSVAPVLTNGQQSSLQLTAAGALIVSTGSAGGTSAVDQSSFIIGSSSETPVGGVYLGGSNVPTLAINQTGAVQLTADRKVVVSDPAMTILLDYVQTLILETRAMRSAIVYMITENQDVLTSDFDPNNQDFQPVN